VSPEVGRDHACGIVPGAPVTPGWGDPHGAMVKKYDPYGNRYTWHPSRAYCFRY